MVPRVGATYAPSARSGRPCCAAASRATPSSSARTPPSVNPLGYSYAYFYFADANSNLGLDHPSAGLSSSPTPTASTPKPGAPDLPNVNDKNLDPTITNEVTLGAEHSFSANFAVGMNFTFRNVTDVPEKRS